MMPVLLDPEATLHRDGPRNHGPILPLHPHLGAASRCHVVLNVLVQLPLLAMKLPMLIALHREHGCRQNSVHLRPAAAWAAIKQASHHVSQLLRILRPGQIAVGVDGWLVAAGVTWPWMEFQLCSVLLVARCLPAVLRRGRRDVTTAVVLVGRDWLLPGHHGEDDRPNRKEFVGDGVRAVLLCHGQPPSCHFM